MGKNIVICCDGTTNQLSLNRNTNVVHLYSCLVKDNSQSTYYHPGIGTLNSELRIDRSIRNCWLKIKDTITAYNINKLVRDAYKFLVETYEEGDEIYLFGFSRGSYTVRMLCGIVHYYGIIYKGNEGHMDYIFNEYSRIPIDQSNEEEKRFFGLANRFKYSFAKEARIKFLGLWDTVVSVGSLLKYYKSYPNSYKLKSVDTVRHAVAVDEMRKHYRYFEVYPNHEDLKEVWFAGVHCDIGGSYREEGLSKITLEWMLGEASNCGLKLDKAKVNRYVYGIGSKYQPPDFTTPIHNSLTWCFILMDFFPRLRYKEGCWPWNFYIDFSLFPLRKIKEGSLVHQSVIDKREAKDYKPKNVTSNLSNYTVVRNIPIVY